jgi:micrococcal nuclease|tara:strand:- start:866 stop:1279 length:414 start_codon:yes stop_codon:yes gene_type:complete
MYQYSVKVVKVIDGDTIDVDIDLGFSVVLAKQRVRLHGIDTPESRTRDKEEKARGLLSKAFLLALCPIGSTIHLHSHGKGKFGRILGEIYEVDDKLVSINKKMCDEAFAVPYFGQSKEDIEELHAANRTILIEKGIL